MKQSEMEKFKKSLLQLRAQLVGALKETSEQVKSADEVKGYSQHQADEGTDDFGRTISLSVSNKEQGILRQIDRALEKIEDGTYGVCDISGKPIPLKRLEAIPYATMTVEAQEQLEKER
ncbi:MAG: TraR/DksA family transcriptional regulator [Chlamydiia bacterium]|nr:TraR/DksA family transcriptional regulator [Chlamydiia bacterium]MCP5492098.1 TraR/DksA family transcriptional regulator [Chlamydiales bacterium]